MHRFRVKFGAHSLQAALILAVVRNRPVQAVIALCIAFCTLGCAALDTANTPTAAGLKPVELVDPTAYGGEGPPPPVFRQLFALGEKVRESQKPAAIPPKRTILLLSGGGSYGAYSAGVLCGWTETGSRPQFDVVTGVSTGALISVFAFLGSEYDAELQRAYTTIHSSEVYRKKPVILAIFSNSLNDNEPLLRQIETAITTDVIEKIALAHKSGRRLYIGTTDLDARRPVVWDLGGIAASGKPESRELICKLLLASAAIPGFFPSVQIPIDVDGKRYVERHVDGGLTQPLFFRPPYIPQDKRNSSFPELFYGTDEYIIVAGKIYADPQSVEPRVLKIVGSSVSTFLYAQTRDCLVKSYMQSMLTGMNYHLTSIPNEFAAPRSATDFEPREMTMLFEEGRRQARAGTAWRNMPPGVGGREELLQRAGTNLTIVPFNGPSAPIHTINGPSDWTLSEQGIPATTKPIVK